MTEQMKKRARGSRDKAYTNIAKVKVTVPGAVEKKAYERLFMGVTLRKKTEETSKVMDRFELKALVEVVIGSDSKKEVDR